jgi:hypothetical protein
MAAKKLAKVGIVYRMTHTDDAGRDIEYFVQVGPHDAISCWIEGHDGGTLTATELFVACCQRTAREGM